MDQRPIGVLDSGIGGLTVVRELLRLLPAEDLVFFSDGANCPYGNRTRGEILALAARGAHFLEERNAKLLTIACNTVSSVAASLQERTSLPLLGIIEPAARRVAADRLEAVGVIATEFTVSTRSYDRQLARLAPETAVFSKGSPLLAALIDAGAEDTAAIDAEIRRQVPFILSHSNVREIVLGCTHYPIVLERFRACCPGVVFIDPAREQALAAEAALKAADSLAERPRGSLTICTTGSAESVRRMCGRLGISALAAVSVESV